MKDKTKEIIDKLRSQSLEMSNHYADDLLDDLEKELSEQAPKDTTIELQGKIIKELSKDTEILDWYDENIVGGDDKNYIDHYITSPLLVLLDVNDEKISEADNIRDLITKVKNNDE